MELCLLVAAFGALGAVSRYAIDGWVGNAARGDSPWGTLLINVSGSFALGVVVELTTSRLLPHPNWRVALGVASSAPSRRSTASGADDRRHGGGVVILYARSGQINNTPRTGDTSGGAAARAKPSRGAIPAVSGFVPPSTV